MRKFRYVGIGMGAALFFLWMSSVNFVYAGDINLPESQILSYLEGTFQVDGVEYKVTEAGKQQVREYLSADDCDLTSKQKSKAIAEFQNNIREGINQGYLVPVTSNQTGQDIENAEDKASTENESPSKNESSPEKESSSTNETIQQESQTSNEESQEIQGTETQEKEETEEKEEKEETEETEETEEAKNPVSIDINDKKDDSDSNQEEEREHIIKDTGFSHNGIQWFVGIGAILCLICLVLAMLVPEEKE